MYHAVMTQWNESVLDPLYTHPEARMKVNNREYWLVSMPLQDEDDLALWCVSTTNGATRLMMRGFGPAKPLPTHFGAQLRPDWLNPYNPPGQHHVRVSWPA